MIEEACMKYIRFILILVLCLFATIMPALAQTEAGGGEIKIVIPKFDLNIPAVSVSASATASGTVIQIAENHLTKTIDCNNESISVMGNNNELTIKGSCTGIQILGNHNTITIETTPELNVAGNYNKISATTVEAIAVMGNYNGIVWTKGTEKDPTISNLGNKNTVNKAAQ